MRPSGNTDHRTPTYVYNEEKRRGLHLETCDQCRGYVKVVSSFSPTPPEMLAVEDLATIHLDYIAQEKGYSRRGSTAIKIMKYEVCKAHTRRP